MLKKMAGLKSSDVDDPRVKYQKLQFPIELARQASF
jgi:hypothetical protein